uniref:Ubiquitin carboxyl-terminal hydrolase n=2 Tax=Cacopsylla melanoneura TaxID=428564 RepID=A0A8D8Y4V3_9HEMI
MATWVPLESNPEVMNQFLAALGVPKKWQIVDVYGTEPDLLAIVPQPILALIMLFPCTDKYEEHVKQQEKELAEKGQEVSKDIYFMKQLIHNACGTIALIHSVANNLDKIELEDGFLKKYLDESKDLTPERRGHLLEDSQSISEVHKVIAQEGQTAPPDDREPVPYHFVALVHNDGALYELDGRKASPIKHGATTPESLLSDASQVAKKYMERDPDNVYFTLVALTAAVE